MKARKVLDKLAKDKGFHPIKEPHKWYSMVPSDFRAIVVCKCVVCMCMDFCHSLY